MHTSTPRLHAIGLLAVLAVICGTRVGHAQDSSRPVVVTASVRAWDSNWSTWGLDQKPYNGSTYQTVAPLESQTAVAWTPQLGVHYGNWFATASYMSKTRYDLDGTVPAGPLRRAIGVRSEVDANLGYYFLPGLAATVGYKELKQQFGSTLKWSGPTLGISGSAPIGRAGLGLYGTVAYGFFDLKLPAGDVDAGGRDSFGAGYTLGEFGLAYSFGFHSGPDSKPFATTLGYRTQTVRTRSYGLSTNPLVGNVEPVEYMRANVRDTTQGFALSLIASF